MSKPTLPQRLENLAAQAVLRSVRLLPYRQRIGAMGWLASHVVAPLAGWRKRIRKNLALARPDLSPKEVAQLERAVPDNIGRVLMELYSGRDFVNHVRGTPLTGPGAAQLEKAHAEGRHLLLLTGHVGNYDVMRAVLFDKGFELGGIYKPMSNPAFNAHYMDAMNEIGTHLFPTDRKGIVGFLRHMEQHRVGGVIADVGSHKAPELTFFGKPARTPLSAAEWALRFDALMVPMFCLRKPDGLDFTIHVEKPIAHTTAEEMMQDFNDRLEAVVRDHMDQWFWIHRRWKGTGAT